MKSTILPIQPYLDNELPNQPTFNKPYSYEKRKISHRTVAVVLSAALLINCCSVCGYSSQNNEGYSTNEFIQENNIKEDSFDC